MWSEKCHRWTCLQGENRDTEVENGHVTWGGRCGGINWGIEIDIYTVPCVKQVASRNLLYSTGAQLDVLWWPRWVGWGWGEGEAQEGRDICKHIGDLLCCSAETNTTLKGNYTLIERQTITGDYYENDHLNSDEGGEGTGRPRNTPSPNQTILFPSPKLCTTPGFPWSQRSWHNKHIPWKESKSDSRFSRARYIWGSETHKQKQETKHIETELFKLISFFQNPLTG